MGKEYGIKEGKRQRMKRIKKTKEEDKGWG
jgi:hypothetical protein